MTALKEYARLESGGLWRATPQDQRREVIVAFGDATLVMTDSTGKPLVHWSLPALERLNPGSRPALYAPDADASETLEITDDLMIDAIEKVRRGLLRARPRPGRLRHAGIALAVAATVGLSVFWLPGALRQQTLSVVPFPKRVEIGATLLGHLQRITGPACRNALSTPALQKLSTRLFGSDQPYQLVVLPDLVDAPILLPGRIIVVPRHLLENQEDPLVLAGYLLAATTSAQATDPLGVLLEHAGLQATFTLLTTGEMAGDQLDSFAKTLLPGTFALPPLAALMDQFTQAGVPTTSLGQALETVGISGADLIRNDPLAGQSPPPVLTDGEWVALQGICAG